VIVSIDGAVVPPERAVISIFDRGLLYGDGVFEVLRTHRGRAVDLARHLERMIATAAELGLIVPGGIAEATVAAIAAAGPGDHRVRILLTGGPGGLTAIRQMGRLVIVVEPLPSPPAGIAAAVVDHPVRTPSRKTLAYVEHLTALALARAAGADEAIRLDDSGRLVEGSTSNVFVVADGLVATPPLARGPLPGIVRRRMLELGAVEQDLGLAELRAADEIFLTSSLRGVVAVTHLDGEPRRAGPTTLRLAAAYDAWMSAADDAAPG